MATILTSPLQPMNGNRGWFQLSRPVGQGKRDRPSDSAESAGARFAWKALRVAGQRLPRRWTGSEIDS